MTEFSIRQINMMQKMCDELIAQKSDPIRFVNNQWALIDLVRGEDPSFWSDYQRAVNQIETIVAIALDATGSLSPGEWNEIEKTIKKLQSLLRDILKGDSRR